MRLAGYDLLVLLWPMERRKKWNKSKIIPSLREEKIKI